MAEGAPAQADRERFGRVRGAAAAAALAAEAPPAIGVGGGRAGPKAPASDGSLRGGRGAGAATGDDRTAASRRRSPRPAHAEAPGAPRAGLPGAQHAAAAARHVEQRLEAERRHFDRQLQRLERRVEEVCACSTGARWAELQGHVDGLAETVQALIRNAGSGSGAAIGTAAMAPASLAADASAFRALQGRVTEVEGQQARFEDALEEIRVSLAVRSRHAHDVSNRLTDVAERLRMSESRPHHAGFQRSLQSAKREADAMEDPLATPPGAGADSRGTADLETSEEPPWDRLDVRGVGSGGGVAISSGTAPLWSESEGLQEGEEDRSDGACTEIDELRDRIGHTCEQVGSLEQEVAARAGALQEQVLDLDARVQELEQGLQDVANAEEVRQEVDRVGEQVMRLALQRQRVARGGAPAEWDNESLHVRRELERVGEELSELWAKSEDADCSVERLAGALARVCEEVASMRLSGNRAGVAGGAPGGADAEPEASGAVDFTFEGAGEFRANGLDELPTPREGAPPRHSAQPPLWCKVNDLERNFNDMAEIVFDLRRSAAARQRGPAAEPPAVVAAAAVAAEAGRAPAPARGLPAKVVEQRAPPDDAASRALPAEPVARESADAAPAARHRDMR